MVEIKQKRVEFFQKNFIGSFQDYEVHYHRESWGFYWLPVTLEFSKVAVADRLDLLDKLQPAEVVAYQEGFPTEIRRVGNSVWHIHTRQEDLAYMEKNNLDLLAYCEVSSWDLNAIDLWEVYGVDDVKGWDRGEEIIVF